jgi:hypothetical protein
MFAPSAGTTDPGPPASILAGIPQFFLKFFAQKSQSFEEKITREELMVKISGMRARHDDRVEEGCF